MAGHRLLLVHLFLPDTLSFHDWPEGHQNTHYRIPGQQTGTQVHVPTLVDEAPPSPSLHDAQDILPVDELRSRLTRASLSRDEDETALSDSDSPAIPIQIPLRTRSARSSFNEQNKKISMSLLMSEAAQGGSLSASSGSTSTTKPSTSPPGNSHPLIRSRRNSPSGNVRPIVTTESPKKEQSLLPITASSDHGRLAASSTMSPPPSNALLSLPGQFPSSSSTSRSRRGSTSGLNNSFHSSMSLSMTPATAAHGQEHSHDGSGTRAPGARVSGMAGTLTPLSIIGDLAAKQSAIQPRQQATPGDSERHHPFGSGAVTPMVVQRSAGPSRTPGGAPPKPFLQQVLSKTPMSLNQTRISEAQERSGRHSESSGNPVRPILPKGRHTTGAKPNSSDHLISNDNGRQATKQVISTASHISGDGPDSRNASRQRQASPAIKQVAAAAVQVNHHPTTSTSTQSSSSSSNWARNKARAYSRTSLGRRPTRTSTRRESSASLDCLFDESLDEEEEEESVLPPYEFAPNPSSNGGLTNAVDSLPRDRLRSGKIHIGTPGISTDAWASDKERRSIAQRFYKEKNSRPVWIDDETFEGAYNQFCKQILWPTFHYTLPTQKGLDNEQESFRNYQIVNEKFAEVILNEYKEGDIIWINDYHLLLVPRLVREKLPHATIGFFLHISFPSSEIFRCLSVRVDILRGMLGSDLIGFQTHNFCRHFRQTVSRILQLEATPKGIQMDGRGGFVTVSAFPIGIDVRGLNRRRAEPEVREWVEKLSMRYEGKKIIVGRDKLDWIKGVRQKLLAFEIFLSEHQEWIGKVVLIQVALATTEENEEVAAATDVIARINNKYSTLTYQPVVFLHVQDITFSQYLALLTVADCCLNSSRREGMGLTPHEYVVCQEEKHRPLILSELSGTYSAMQACIGINPWNTKQMAHAIYKALTMSDEEAFDRWKDLHRQVVTQTAQHWIQSLLGRLEKAHINRERKNNFFIPRLEIGQLVSEWRASKSRLLLFDLEDTLIEEEDVSKINSGSLEKVLKKLQELCSDARNRVYVLSGRGASDLDKLVARIPRLGLIAENGCSVMYAGEPEGDVDEGEGGKEWMSLVAGTDLSWRAPVKEILSYFTERTPGSQLEDRGASILWQFWSGKESDCDDENRDFQWSRRQAAEVQNLIYDSLGERFSIRIIPGQSSFLIMPKNVSRASAVQHIISLSHIGRAASMHGISSSSSVSLIGRSPRISPVDRLRSEEISTDSSTFKRPSNHWQPSKARRNSSSRWQIEDKNLSFTSRSFSTASPYSLHPNGMGSFDFVLCIGQDDMLLSYINSLDLPFAPVTCTSTYCDESGHSHNDHGGGSSEANYFLHGIQDVYSNLEEIVAFKGRDQKWGHATLDV